MNYIRWREAVIKGDKCSDLVRGYVYRDKQGAVYVYVGYCDLYIPAFIGTKPYRGKGHVFIRIFSDYTSPFLDVTIENFEKAAKANKFDVYLNMSDDPKLGGQTLFVYEDPDAKHNMFSHLYEFEILDEYLWCFDCIQCNYFNIYKWKTDDIFFKIIREQKSKSYLAYLVDKKGMPLKYKGNLFYQVSIANETHKQFYERVCRALDLFLSLLDIKN